MLIKYNIYKQTNFNSHIINTILSIFSVFDVLWVGGGFRVRCRAWGRAWAGMARDLHGCTGHVQSPPNSTGVQVGSHGDRDVPLTWQGWDRQTTFFTSSASYEYATTLGVMSMLYSASIMFTIWFLGVLKCRPENYPEVLQFLSKRPSLSQVLTI